MAIKPQFIKSKMGGSSFTWKYPMPAVPEIAVYTFDATSDVMPTFNAEFTNYTVKDVDNGDGTIIRTIKASSLPTSISFEDKSALLSVEKLDTSNVTNMSNMFLGCTSLTSIDLSNFDTSNVTTMNSMFYNCNRLTSLDLSSFDTSSVDNMTGMFYKCSSLTSLDLSNFNTSNVTNMDYMFSSCSSLTSLDLSKFNTSKVTNMSNMFFYCSSLTSLDLSNFNTNNVDNMSNMFFNCSSLTSLDLSNFNTSKVNDMNSMFYNCNRLTSLDLSSFDTSSVDNMTGMFYNCTSLTSLDLSNFNTSNVTNMSCMFNRCTNLTSLDVSNFDTSNVKYTDDMFYHVSDTINWNYDGNNYSNFTLTEEQTSYNYYFPWRLNYVEYTITPASDTSLINEKVENIDDPKWYGYVYLPERYLQRDTQLMILNNEIKEPIMTLTDDSVAKDTSFRIIAHKLQPYERVILYLKNGSTTTDINTLAKDVEKIRYYYPKNYNVRFRSIFNYFNDPYNHRLTSVLHFNTENFTSFDSLFLGCDLLTSIDVTDYCSNKVTSLYQTFIYCHNLTEIIGLETWDTSNVTDMSYLFYKNVNITDLTGVTNWDTRNVILMTGTFAYCNNLTNLNISNWDTSKVTSMATLFTDCISLNSIDISKWDTSKVEFMTSMFANYRGAELDLSNFDTSNVKYMFRMFDGCSNLTSLDLSSFNTSKVTNYNNLFGGMTSNNNVYYNSIIWNLPTSGSGFDVTFIDTVNRFTFDLSLANSEATKTTIALVDQNNIGSANYLTNWGDGTVDNNLSHTYADNGTYIVSTRLQLGQEASDDVLGIRPTDLSSVIDEEKPYKNITDPRSNQSTVQLLKVDDTDLEGNILTMKDTNATKSLISAYLYIPTTCAYLFNKCINLQSVDLSHFNTSSVESMEKMFFRCYSLSELIGIENLNTSNVKCMWDTFAFLNDYNYDSTNNLIKVPISLDLSRWDVSNVTDMSCMFSICRTLETLDISTWNTNKVTDMSWMFEIIKISDSNLVKGLTTLDTSNVTLFSGIFNSVEFTSLDLSRWNVSNALEMKNMFSWSNITSINLNNWNTSKLQKAYEMFAGCKNLLNIDLSSFNTSNATDISWMFAYCSSLTTLDLSNFNTNKVEFIDGMFSECTALTSLNISSFNTSKVTNMSYMFDNCSKLTSLNLSNFDTSKVTNMSKMFDNVSCPIYVSSRLFKQDINMNNLHYLNDYIFNIDTDNTEITLYGNNTFTNWGDGTVINGISNTHTFVNAGEYRVCTWNELNDGTKEYFSVGDNDNTHKYIKSVYLAHTDLTNMQHYASASPLLEEFIIHSKLDTSNVTDMLYMFNGCSSLTSLDLSKFNTSNVTNMFGMFTNCSSLNTLNISNFDTGKVQNMSYMFALCSSLTSLNLSNFNTSNVTIMFGMFYNCSSLTSLDLSSFNTSNVTDMIGMFFHCSSLTSLDLSNFNTSKVTDINAIFDNVSCPIYVSSRLFKQDITMNNLYYLNDYIFNIDTDNTEITLYGNNTFTNWGDGTIVNGEVSNTHTFITAGEYRVCTWNELNDGTKEYNNIGDNDNTHKYIKSVYLAHTDLTNMNYYVSTSPLLEEFIIHSKLDTSNVITVQDMFSRCSSLTTLNLSNFNTSSITDMISMFYSCSSLTSLNISNFNTSNVTSMSYMFSNCSSLTSLNLSNFNTSKVKYMAFMFSNCSSLTSLDLSSFSTSNVTSMLNMFADCSSLTSLDLSNFNTSKVKYMSYMFEEVPTTVDWNYDGSNYTNFTLTKEETGYSGTFPWNE